VTIDTTSALRAPNLADFIRDRRTRPRTTHPRGYSREELSGLMHHSASYLAQLETGQKLSPTADWCDAFAGALGLTAIEIQHLQNLAMPPQSGPRLLDPPPIEAYRDLVDEDMRAAARDLEPHLVAYLDERWNVLHANDAYAKAQPGLLDDGNVLIWYFRNPHSREVMMDWLGEARHLVAWFRAQMARYQSPAWAMDLLVQLGKDPDFGRMWRTEDVEFGRPSPYMRLRDGNGVAYRINVEITHLSRGYPLQKFLGVKGASSGA
jgi:hypothetical protein